MTTKRHALILINPHAGSGKHEVIGHLLSDTFRQHQWTVTCQELLISKSSNEIVQLLKDECGQGTSMVIAAGGDGTASYVAHSIVQANLATSVCLGLFPGGTANTLTQELGVPSDWTAAAHFLATNASSVNMDAMKIGQRYYFLRVGIGIDAETIRETKDIAKRRFGRWAYFQSLLNNLRTPHRHLFRCRIDGKKRQFYAVQLFVANGGGLALAPFRLGPAIDLADGEVNVCGYDALNRLDYCKLIWNLMLSRYQEQPSMKFWLARQSIHIQTHRPLAVQADGEYVGTTPIQIRVMPAAIRASANVQNK